VKDLLMRERLVEQFAFAVALDPDTFFVGGFSHSQTSRQQEH
jgi:hypothetical protein